MSWQAGIIWRRKVMQELLRRAAVLAAAFLCLTRRAMLAIAVTMAVIRGFDSNDRNGRSDTH